MFTSNYKKNNKMKKEILVNAGVVFIGGVLLFAVIEGVRLLKRKESELKDKK